MTTTQPDGYLALPPGGAGPGVLLLHAWWGLNGTVKSFADRLAEEGFVVFAPDLYHGRIAITVPEAEALAGLLDERFEKARGEVIEAARYLGGVADGRALAAIGFSLGAAYALDLSAAAPELIDRVVVYYGASDADFETARATYLAHFAADDPYEPPENVAYLQGALGDAGRAATVYTYDNTGHWFCEPDRPDAYDEEAAELAHARTLEFLRQPRA